MHTQDVTKGLTFTLRLDERDRIALDEVAAYFAEPAATVIRMLIKEKHRAIQAAPPPPSAPAKKRPRKP